MGVEDPGGGTTGGGTTTGGTSGNPFGTVGTTTTTDEEKTTSSSSSGGSSEPKVDPVVAQKMNLFNQIYMQLWGEPATEAYLKAAANSGMNTWEFARAEREKPAWADTDAYKKKADDLATMLANLGVG